MDSEKINEMMKEADSMYTLVQRLDIKPTEGNLQILTGCLGSLRFIYDTLNAMKEAADNERAADAE